MKKASPYLQSVLIVDDDPVSLMVLARLLLSHYQVLTAPNGMEALRILRRLQKDQTAHLPIVTFLDVAIPGLDGFQTLEIIRIFFEEMPVIMCTSLCRSCDVIRAQQLGATDYVVKPYKKHTILRKLEKILSSAKLPHIHQNREA
jgi:CheY-like chemotaxis protein